MDLIHAGQQGRIRREGNAIENDTAHGVGTGHGDDTGNAVGEAADPHCLRPGEARALLAGAPWRRLVVLGDLAVERAAEPVEGYGTQPWYDRVAAALDEAAEGVAYLNLLGRRAARAAQVRSGQLPAALAFRGDLALVCCGTAYTPDETFGRYGLTAELVRIVAPLRDAGHDVVLVGSPPLAAWPGLPADRRERVAEQQRRVSEQARAVALRHGTLYVDPGPRPPRRGGPAPRPRARLCLHPGAPGRLCPPPARPPQPRARGGVRPRGA
ncbi:GDSL-type esterase/lipase family protein, partial [Streptomyces sp. NPDC059134]|uniref:GDSL-type esterase/lipase family protein n=2 Tax=unclassified Streptomyces TaxID=2593676 RepID=UPI00367B7099